jgi:CspA family cold shock protein
MFPKGHKKASGTLRFFNSDNFGFITPNAGGSDMFVHFSASQASELDTQRDGQKVSFDTERAPGNGPKAVKSIDEA